MDLSFTAEDAAFQLEIREFLRANLPSDVARHQRHGYQPDRVHMQEWQRILYKKGWVAPHWPTEYGGTGWSPVQQFLFELECGMADAPDISVPALHLVGPVIYQYGSAELKRRFLEPILRGDLYFAQGFSEPQAGSDLANVRTRAVRDRDELVIDGQKMWTSQAHHADWIFVLVRTDMKAKPQLGLSMVLVPISAAGLTVRPIYTIDNAHHINEIFFDGVRVSSTNLIGEENHAWTYAKYLLDNERTYNAHIGLLMRMLSRARELIFHRQCHNAIGHTNGVKARLARLEFDAAALQWSVLRVLSSGHAGPGLTAAASALKIRGSTLLTKASELQMEIMGREALPRYESIVKEATGAAAEGFRSVVERDAPGIFEQAMYWRASTIFGGSNDIQRGIIWNHRFRDN